MQTSENDTESPRELSICPGEDNISHSQSSLDELRTPGMLTPHISEMWEHREHTLEEWQAVLLLVRAWAPPATSAAAAAEIRGGQAAVTLGAKSFYENARCNIYRLNAMCLCVIGF